MSSNNETLPSNITLPPSTIIVILDQVKVKFVDQLPLMITVLGIIGFIGNAFTFLQPTLRNNSFSIYTLCSSLVDIINIFINLLPKYLSPVLVSGLPPMYNSFLCKLKLFSLVFLPQLSIDLLIMSLIDRYACTFDLLSPMRQLLELKKVPWLIGITVTISCIISLYSPILYDATPYFGCVPTDPMLNGMLYIIIHGIMTPIIMLVIMLLTYRRFKQGRQRIGPTAMLNINRFRNQFIIISFAQAFGTGFLVLPWIGTYLYFITTQYENKSAEEWAVISFCISLTNNLYYGINAKSFYLSTLTSRLFRDIFTKALLKLIPRQLHRR